MLNIHLGNTVVTALAKCIFFWTLLAGANFFSDCFFLSERLRFRSPRIVKERAPASEYVFYMYKPERSEGVFIKFSVYSLLKRIVLFIIYIVRRAKRAVNSLFTFFLRKQFCILLVFKFSAISLVKRVVMFIIYVYMQILCYLSSQESNQLFIYICIIIVLTQRAKRAEYLLCSICIFPKNEERQ